ncbi:hypothetical protein CMUS01_02112 [Colletotrichum musicola]|uniref:Uncharacterized protein n=1 Tax=Colletotrichum musicola TaxID=2175873 RepID=A0A8H6NVK4_9PEZI|nr:hypothetical protein CMUS01_02112 [Colletotrichum musicola]
MVAAAAGHPDSYSKQNIPPRFPASNVPAQRNSLTVFASVQQKGREACSATPSSMNLMQKQGFSGSMQQQSDRSASCPSPTQVYLGQSFTLINEDDDEDGNQKTATPTMQPKAIARAWR